VKLSDFDYELPPERIAQVPAEPRDAARLLVHDPAPEHTEHSRVSELPRFLRRGDLLVFNDTRVRRARLFGARASGGRVEFLFLERLPPCPASARARWRALVHPARKLRAGEAIRIEGGGPGVRLLERPRAAGAPQPFWEVEFDAPPGVDEEALFERHGHVPLPPYIERDPPASGLEALDRERYQTVFARSLGAVAAPTAGLHFTPELLARLEQAGVERAFVTLHVGLGTFQPVQVEDPSLHRMHAEAYELPAAAALAVSRARERGGRVIAVGTTSCRVLETCADGRGGVRAGGGSTALFLLPGRRFQAVDALFTNFHLPRSTLLMLVSAFAGRERVLALYREAVARGYRFYSYGDAMLLGAGG
jgi:S-adenosylmethionine:tRNA ribosyltransferase-isomerase